MSDALRFNAGLFKAVQCSQSTEKHRPYLGGVFVQPHEKKGVLLTATNAFTLIHAWDENGNYPSWLNPTGTLLKEQPGTPVSLFKASCNVDNVNVVLEKDNRDFQNVFSAELKSFSVIGHVQLKEIDADFPDYVRVIPRFSNETAGIGALSVRNVSQITKAFEFFENVQRASSLTKNATFRLFGPEDSSSEAALALSGLSGLNGYHLLGVIMPVREEIKLNLPRWIGKVRPNLRKTG